MGKIKKAVIPAAGWGTRFLPATKAIPKGMLPIVDKPAIQYIVEEAVEAGVEEIAVLTGENDQAIKNHFYKNRELESVLIRKNDRELLGIMESLDHMADLRFIRQEKALGLGHAIWCTRHFVGNEPFAVLLGDMICDGPGSGIKPLIEVYHEKQASMIGVKPVLWSEAGKYGVISGDSEGEHLVLLKDLVEKPGGIPPSNLAIMGRYILKPKIFEMIEQTAAGAGGEIQLTDALRMLLEKEHIYAYRSKGKIYDVGNKLGFLQATVEMALKHDKLKADFGLYLQKLAANIGAAPQEEE